MVNPLPRSHPHSSARRFERQLNRPQEEDKFLRKQHGKPDVPEKHQGPWERTVEVDGASDDKGRSSKVREVTKPWGHIEE
ncbi:hypothetical protein VTL71DRAFT_9646 [Oculimacula yallundae]|uniref:Uncharacterized protein n=1 Tax=Oculimacula yallundae TaxID=86028 RepID=A0ABR4BRF4_9HELO